MDTKEIFETVKAHLLKQNVRSTDEHANCMYRTKDGRSCAVGCLIHDDNYAMDLEMKNLFEGNVREAVESSIGKLSSDDFRMLRSLQQMHDSWEVEDWEGHLDKLEEEYV